MDLGLAGRRALVTGASRGIGRAVAEALAAEGVHLELAARSAAGLEALRDTLRAAHGVRVGVHPVDLAASGAAETLAAAVDAPDLLVNNAGAIPAGTLDAVDEARWRAAWELKVFGYVNLCRACYARMRAAGGGVIVNVIGTGGERHDPGYVAGVTANAGLMAFTRALGAAGPADGIRVVGVNPGITRTDRMEQQARRRAEAAGLDPENWRQALPALPFDRPAEPAEIADVVAFLASPRAGYVSGTVVTVDGGHSVAPDRGRP
ncbi:MAG: short-chain dehydrogenase/reductase [Pseudomonadales bacterium]|jgi:NAD(P)-dependent dehydrogenase (short-subunit alcohol dehydrogenase family)|nr:short-chain dehydrogenase/reductase [Pseudomonadales bacterium]